MKLHKKFPEAVRQDSDIIHEIGEYVFVTVPTGMEFYAKVSKKFEVTVEFVDEDATPQSMLSDDDKLLIVAELKRRLGTLVRRCCETGVKFPALDSPPPVHIHGVIRFVSVVVSPYEYDFQSPPANNRRFSCRYSPTPGEKTQDGWGFSNMMQIVVVDMVHKELKLERGYVPRRVTIERIVSFFNEASFVECDSQKIGGMRLELPEGGIDVYLFTVPRVLCVGSDEDDDMVDKSILMGEVDRVMGGECERLMLYSKEGRTVLDVRM